MQTTIYIGKDDKYLINLVGKKAEKDRKSRSAVILEILEQYFEQGKTITEILIDIGALTPNQLKKIREKTAKDHKSIDEELQKAISQSEFQHAQLIYARCQATQK